MLYLRLRKLSRLHGASAVPAQTVRPISWLQEASASLEVCLPFWKAKVLQRNSYQVPKPVLMRAQRSMARFYDMLNCGSSRSPTRLHG